MKLLISLILVIIFSPSIFADTFYVDQNHVQSSDSNNGTIQSPWKTLQHAADHISAGDTVIIQGGSFQDLIISNSGLETAPIVFQGIHQDSVHLTGIEIAKGITDIQISGLSIEDDAVWGIFVRGTNQRIVLKDLKVMGCESGIHLTWGVSAEEPYDGPVSHILIENCEIENSVYTGVDCTPGPCTNLTCRNLTISGSGIDGENSWGADGIAVEKGDTLLIEDCEIFNNGGDGIDLNSRDFNGNISNVIVRRNQVYRNHRTGIKLWGGGRIGCNAVWGQGSTAIYIGAFPGSYEIINNTIAYNMWDPNFSIRNYAFCAAYPDESGVSVFTQLTLVNNIFAFNSNNQMGGPTGLYFGEGVQLIEEGNNLFWSRSDGEIQAEFLSGQTWYSQTEIQNGSWAAESGQGVGDLAANPLFIAGWPDVDLRLSENSPAINAGKSQPKIDLDADGQNRSVGSQIDIGAYEYQSISSLIKIQTEQVKSSIQISPNPFNLSVQISFTLQKQTSTSLVIYNVLGKKVKSFHQGDLAPGVHYIIWDGQDQFNQQVSSGIYLAHLNLGNNCYIRKLSCIK